MAEILLVNPSLRTGAKEMAKHRMPTALRKYWAKHRHNPSRHHKRHRHHYRHNPFSVSGFKNTAMGTLEGGAIGAVGAIASDVLYSYTKQYLPTSITTSTAGTAAVSLLYAILVGVIGGKVWSGKGSALAVGAATVAIHDLAYSQLVAAGLPLAGFGNVGAYMSYGPTVGARTMAGIGNTSQGRSVVRQLQRTTTGMGRMGGLGAYMSRQGVKVPQRGMGAYMSGVGDTTFANGIPTG